MQIDVRLRAPILFRDDATFARVVRLLCEAAIMSNRLYLRATRTPPLYRSGVVYQDEPHDLPDELLDIPTILRRKWGDCMHLSCWRVAELREAGEHARIALAWQRVPSNDSDQPSRIFHVLVRRANGKLEDPSKILGM